MNFAKNSFIYITLLLEPNKSGKDFSVPQTKLTSWINRFSKWTTSLFAGEPKPSSTFIEIYSTDSLLIPEKAKKLANTIAKNGYTLSLHINFRDIVLRKDILEETLKDKPNLVNIHFSQEDLPYKKSLEAALKWIYAKSHSVHMYGAHDIISEFNIYASETANAKGISIFPEGKNIGAAKPRFPIKPCESRMQLHVAKDGKIYPCMGLAYAEKFPIGHISDVEFGHYLTYKCGEDSIETLYKKGPKIKTNGKTTSDAFSWICRRHLHELA